MHSRWSLLAPLGLYATTAWSSPVDFVNPLEAVFVEFGAIGDSWASGVTAKPSDNYKQGDNSPCLITNYAYAAQLEKDKSWANGRLPALQFAACSGARLHDMAAKDGGQQQMKNTGKPYLVTMTAGGNDAGFFSIARDCIYQQDPSHDYGPDFPDQGGECAKSVQTSSKYIHGTQGSLEYDMRATLTDVFDTDNARSRGDQFLLYLTGYAQFFAVQDGDGKDWCDGESFGAIPLTHQPKLTKAVRRAINGLAVDLNNLYSDIAKGWTANKGLRFVDIDPSFNGHRFCEEPTADQKAWWHSAQYYGDYVHIWNLSPPQLDGILDPAVATQSVDTKGLTYTPPLTTQSGSGGENSGSALRPFHPKPAGYTGIKDAIIAQIKKDKPGFNPAGGLGGGSTPQPKPACTDPKQGVSPSTATAQKMLDQLTKSGDGTKSSSTKDGCSNIAAGNADGLSVDLCSETGTGPDTISDGESATYVKALIGGCTKDGMVSGKVDVDGHKGLSVQM